MTSAARNDAYAMTNQALRSTFHQAISKSRRAGICGVHCATLEERAETCKHGCGLDVTMIDGGVPPGRRSGVGVEARGWEERIGWSTLESGHRFHMHPVLIPPDYHVLSRTDKADR